MKQKRVSDAVIRRLPKYYRELQELKRTGVDRISSGALAARMGLNASQIRQDFNCFGGYGQQGYGYTVDALLTEIAGILGLTDKYNLVVVGAGNMGTALTHYQGFRKDGYDIIAAFDNDPGHIGVSIGEVVVKDIDQMGDFLRENTVDIGIICTSKHSAQDVCDKLMEGGVRAIWNFAPVDVKVKPGVFVENIFLIDDLYALSYRMKHAEQ